MRVKCTVCVINILVLGPFQLKQEKKTNGGYKHYP